MDWEDAFPLTEDGRFRFVARCRAGTTRIAGPTRSCCSMIRRPAWPCRRSNGLKRPARGKENACETPRHRRDSAGRGPGAGRRYNTGRRRSRTTRRRATTPMAIRWPWTNKAWSTWTARITGAAPVHLRQWSGLFQDGLARHVENGKMGFHDEALKVVIPARYDFAFPFRDRGQRMDCVQYRRGTSSVQCKSWASIDKAGRRVETQARLSLSPGGRRHAADDQTPEGKAGRQGRPHSAAAVIVPLRHRAFLSGKMANQPIVLGRYEDTRKDRCPDRGLRARAGAVAAVAAGPGAAAGARAGGGTRHQPQYRGGGASGWRPPASR